jgi:hypothetical protein
MGRRSNRGRGGHRSRPRQSGNDQRGEGPFPGDRNDGQQPPPVPAQESDFNRYREQAPPRSRNLPSMMRRMFLGATADVTVVVRTHNGDAYLEELLASLLGQEMDREIEILAVDADSTDRTPLILRARGIRTLHARANSDYLDQVLKTAEGDAIVFLSQDTLPLKPDWLKHLTVPLLEDPKMGLAYGRVIADATVPAYQRGLISARAFVSGKQTLGYTNADAPGAHFFPSTNVAGRKKALMQMGTFATGNQSLQKFYANDWSKFYLPHAVAVIKGETTSQALFDALATHSGAEPGAMGNMVKAEISGLLRELYELSTVGDLPRGERGEAYLSAVTLHSQRTMSVLQERHPLLKKLVTKLSG